MPADTEPLWPARQTDARACPVCGEPLGLLRRRCRTCGYCARDAQRAHRARPGAALAAGMLLQERYAVGGAAAGRRGADGGQSFWGYDRREDCIVYLTAYAVAPEAQAAFLARAAALRTLSGCEAVAVPLDAFAAGQWMVAVTLPPERTLAERGQLLSDAALLALLDRLTDALLVVHSLDGQMGGNGSAVHGAPSPEAIWFFPDGRVRLFVPPVPAKGDPSDDIRGFGRVLAAAGASRSPALGAILARMCAGGYASVLEIKHELNWL